MLSIKQITWEVQESFILVKQRERRDALCKTNLNIYRNKVYIAIVYI